MRQNTYDDPTFFDGYQRVRASPTSLNQIIEQPELRRCLPPLGGLHVLDLGCGAGEFAIRCIEQGATMVVGVDTSKKMLVLAGQQHPRERITNRREAMEEVRFDRDTFDPDVSPLC